MAIGHLERLGVAKVDLLLSEPPLALAVFDRYPCRLHAVAHQAVEPFGFRSLEDVVILDIAAVRFQLPVVLYGGLLVGIPEKIKLELGPGLGIEAELARTVDLAAQRLARSHLDRLTLHRLDIAQNERRLLQPGQPPNG